MGFSVLGLGAVAMDVVLQCENLPMEDGFSFVYREKLLPGGSCANVLSVLTCLGTPSGIMAQVGDDYYGTMIGKDLNEVGINTSHLFVKPNGTSLHTFITIARDGSKAIFANMGDSLLTLSEDNISSDMLKGIKVFYNDMFAGKPALKLARLCRGAGIPVVFNLQCPPAFMNLCGVSSDELEEMISISHLFISCREGLFELAGTEDFTDAVNKVHKKYKTEGGLVATRGASGANWINQDEHILTGVFKVDAVDTTGAGDAFAGGLIHAYFIRRLSREKSLKFASACAALCCTRLGARVKTSETEVERFINNYSQLNV